MSPQLALVAVVVLLVAAIGGYFALKGGGSSHAATQPPVVPRVASSSAVPAAAGLGLMLPRVSAAVFAHRVERAIAHQRGVHIALTATDGGVPDMGSGDVGLNTGTQLIEVAGQVMEGRFVHRVLYVNGSATLLQHLAGFPAQVAAMAAGSWVALHQGDKPYARGVQGMTIGKLYPATLGLIGQLHLVQPQVQAGAETIGISGRDYGAHDVPETVWVRAQGTPLPVLDTAVGTDSRQGSVNESTTFSNWSLPVHVTVPRGAVPYQRLASQVS